MNQQLIPIIAAYWGAECSYTLLAGRPTEVNKSKLNGVHLERMGFAFYRDFKLHLRPLWSITEDELRELGEVLGLKDPIVSIFKHKKMISDDVGINYIILYKKLQYPVITDDAIMVKLINHLRAKGFCVDQELVDANLVEWK